MTEKKQITENQCQEVMDLVDKLIDDGVRSPDIVMVLLYLGYKLGIAQAPSAAALLNIELQAMQKACTEHFQETSEND